MRLGIQHHQHQGFKQGKEMDDAEEIFFLQEQKGCRGRKTWTTWEIKGLGTEGCILKKLSEVQKRNKLKTGRCVDKKLRP